MVHVSIEIHIKLRNQQGTGCIANVVLVVTPCGPVGRYTTFRTSILSRSSDLLFIPSVYSFDFSP
jgi:hypothetical protein